MVDAVDDSRSADGRAIPSEDAHTAAIGEMSEKPVDSTPELDLRFDADADLFIAHRGDDEVGYVSIGRAGPHRVLLRALGVVPEYRGQGIATSLARKVLDRLQEDGESVTVLCPAVRSFIAQHPEYGERPSIDIGM